MTEVTEHRPMGTRAVYEHITRYIDDNKHSRDVNVRWLCANMEPLLARISAIMNNRPTNADKQLITCFRATEIEKEIANRHQDVERLERELRDVQQTSACT